MKTLSHTLSLTHTHTLSHTHPMKLHYCDPQSSSSLNLPTVRLLISVQRKDSSVFLLINDSFF